MTYEAFRELWHRMNHRQSWRVMHGPGKWTPMVFYSSAVTIAALLGGVVVFDPDGAKAELWESFRRKE